MFCFNMLVNMMLHWNFDLNIGRYEGDTGLIVRVENNRVVLISDLTMHEMEILPKDLQLCTDMASGVDSLGKFEWGDLVNLDSETVGVIVRLERENFHVLNMHGMFHTHTII